MPTVSNIWKYKDEPHIELCTEQFFNIHGMNGWIDEKY